MPKFPNAVRSLCAGLILSLAGACGGDAILQPTAADQQAIASVADKPYRLQPGEKVRITVYGETGLSGEYQIDPTGFISLPLAGVLKPAGFTENNCKQQLVSLYRKKYQKTPKITFSVPDSRPF